MKQQLEGEELIQGLYEVKNLLIAMENMNEKERQAREQIRQILPVQNVQIKNQQKKEGWIVLLVVAFILMTLFLAVTYAPKKVSDSERAYEKALVDDEFSWSMQHIGDNETYPGYSGSVEEPMTFGTAYMKSLPKAGMVSMVLVVIAGAVIFSIQKSRNIAIDKRNKIRTEQYQAALEQNNQIMAYNQRIQMEIEAINQRRLQISKEYLTNLCKWYPEDYAYMDAVKYFIHQIELGTATTLPEAIKLYHEQLFRSEVTENQRTMINNQEVMINNQKIMISKQDEMIRQQMLGNVIAAATLMQTMSIAKSVRGIEANTSAAARSARGIEANTSATAKYAGDIAWNTRR